MKPTREIKKLLPSPGGSEPAGKTGQRPRTCAEAPVKSPRVSKSARPPKFLGPDSFAILFPENKDAAVADAGITRGQTAAEAAKATPSGDGVLIQEAEDQGRGNYTAEHDRQHRPRYVETLKDCQKIYWEVSWDVYRVRNPRSLALALLLD
jgi:hypothetical protein